MSKCKLNQVCFILLFFLQIVLLLTYLYTDPFVCRINPYPMS